MIIPGVASKAIRVSRMILNGSAAGTIDIQDTGGASLLGGVLTMTTTQNWLVLDCQDMDYHRQCPWFVLGVGLGLQLVVTGSINVAGIIDYLLNPP